WRVWGTWVPTKPDLSTGVSLLAKDLQGMLLVYDVEGKLISTVRPGMATKVNDINLKIIDIIGSTGLQIKADPGIPLVYTGFALLMLGVIASYFSHSQIWAWQQGVSEASPQEIGLYVGGKTNRAQVAFEREVIEILEKMSKSKQEIPSLKAASLVN
ncbi:MAG: cytochrome c biogenesis protein, partial [Symploca sp. SIO1C4]|nr:cytochrome c biogenesis protein [Symploca sp. SIO1C4]